MINHDLSAPLAESALQSEHEQKKRSLISHMIDIFNEVYILLYT